MANTIPPPPPKPTAASSLSTVQKGYDQIASTYLAWSTAHASPRVAQLEHLLALLPSVSLAQVLELGCGAGMLSTQLLVARCGRVVANDISEAQLELARERFGSASLEGSASLTTSASLEGSASLDGSASLTTPASSSTHASSSNVHFIHGDMASLSFTPASFDAVVAFYSILHLPRDQQAAMFGKIASWLKPGGYLLCNLATEDDPGRNQAWLGTEMFFSSFDEAGNSGMIREAGLILDKVEVLIDDEGETKVPFQWILARKPVREGAGGDA